jgi:hypothetical protein
MEYYGKEHWSTLLRMKMSREILNMVDFGIKKGVGVRGVNGIL